MEATGAPLSRNALAAVTITLVVLLAAGAAYGLADALRALPAGDAPGEGPAGSHLFVGFPALALLLSGFGSIYLAGRGTRPPLAWLVAPLGAAFMLAHFYSYDEYCGGYGCRFADEVSSGAAHWAWGLALAGFLAGAVTWRLLRPGLLLTSAVTILCALTVFFVPFGH